MFWAWPHCKLQSLGFTFFSTKSQGDWTGAMMPNEIENELSSQYLYHRLEIWLSNLIDDMRILVIIIISQWRNNCENKGKQVNS